MMFVMIDVIIIGLKFFIVIVLSMIFDMKKVLVIGVLYVDVILVVVLYVISRCRCGGLKCVKWLMSDVVSVVSCIIGFLWLIELLLLIVSSDDMLCYRFCCIGMMLLLSVIDFM